MPSPSVLYLHGFASGPASHKAVATRAWAEARGTRLVAPDLNGASFSTLTIGGQLEVARAALAQLERPVLGIGSSLGGYLCALLAVEGRLDACVLMCPAFDFARRMSARLGPDVLAEWRRKGTTRVYHHSERAERDVGIAILDEAQSHDAIPAMPVPCTIIHGFGDPDVPLAQSRDYARAHPGVKLVEVDDDHTLHRSIPRVLEEAEARLAELAR